MLPKSSAQEKLNQKGLQLNFPRQYTPDQGDATFSYLEGVRVLHSGSNDLGRHGLNA
jgi:hypothetical protein